MPTTAYLLLGIDTTTLKLNGCSIYSSEQITHDLRVFMICLHKESGDDFADATLKLIDTMRKSPSLSWAIPLLRRNVNTGEPVEEGYDIEE